jgi:hypothetical protein
MNLTRRILAVRKGHTFSYQNKEYPVSALIKFCEGKSSIEALPSAFEQYLMDNSVDRVWGSYDDRRKQELPVTLHDLIDHYDRIQKADLKYPVILLNDPKGLRVLDGIHRILKANIVKGSRLYAITLTPEDMTEFTTGC